MIYRFSSTRTVSYYFGINVLLNSPHKPSSVALAPVSKIILTPRWPFPDAFNDNIGDGADGGGGGGNRGEVHIRVQQVISHPARKQL